MAGAWPWPSIASWGQLVTRGNGTLEDIDYNNSDDSFVLKSDEFSALLIDARGLWPIAR